MSMMGALHRTLPCLVLMLAITASGCRRKPEKPKSSKKKREEAIQQAGAEQMALIQFTASVRALLQWHRSQPPASTAADRQRIVRELALQMEKVPVSGLAEDLAETWKPMLKAWRELAKTDSPDASLIEKGSKAAAELNLRLLAHGIADIRF